MSLVRSTFCPWDHSFEGGCVCGLAAGGDGGAGDADGGGVIAVEEGGVDFRGGDGAGGDAEGDYDPVVGERVVAAGLPAIVPGARVDEMAFALDGGCGSEEV